MKKKMNNLKQSYESACNAYLKAFCLKHDFDYEPDCWVGKYVGTICQIADYFVDMTTIRTDIDMDAKEDEFIKWYDYSLRVGTLGCTGIPNFENWLRRCPIRSEDEILAMEATRRKIEELEKELKTMCDEHPLQKD